jgi:hypothetical protein
MRISRAFTMLNLLVMVSLLTGCSISYSVGKSSDSISASSDSISGSSNSGGEKAATAALSSYAEDIAAATVLFASGQTNSEQFLQTVTTIGRSHGIINWELEQETYAAMGKGLKRAGIGEKQIANLPYFSTFVGTADYKLVLQGFHQS